MPRDRETIAQDTGKELQQLQKDIQRLTKERGADERGEFLQKIAGLEDRITQMHVKEVRQWFGDYVRDLAGGNEQLRGMSLDLPQRWRWEFMPEEEAVQNGQSGEMALVIRVHLLRGADEQARQGSEFAKLDPGDARFARTTSTIYGRGGTFPLHRLTREGFVAAMAPYQAVLLDRLFDIEQQQRAERPEQRPERGQQGAPGSIPDPKGRRRRAPGSPGSV